MNKQELAYATLRSATISAAAGGHPVEAHAILLRAVALLERHLGEDNLQYAMAVQELADLCADQKAYAAAEAGYLKALAIYEDRLPPTDGRILQAMRALADVYHHDGRHAEAKRMEFDAGKKLSSRLRSS